MAERIRVGDRLPFFLYDTPYSAGNRFRDLLDAQAPLVLVFMANFGHPITRTFASRYADTYTSLHDGGFALVVRSRADKLARSIGPDTLPYPLLCDAAGVLLLFLSPFFLISSGFPYSRISLSTVTNSKPSAFKRSTIRSAASTEDL